jgi:ribosomal protein L37AE/L43A
MVKGLDGFRELVKNTKHKKPAAIFCPRCASPKIHLTSSLSIWLTPRQYYCEECGYVGIVVMELEEDKQDKQEKEETDA